MNGYIYIIYILDVDIYNHCQLITLLNISFALGLSLLFQK